MVAIVGLSMACLSSACSDDDPAPQTAPNGSVGAVDASVRELRGDGLEITPESDIEMREREPIGPQAVNDAVEDIVDYLGGAGGQSSSAPDAATGPVDAGAD